MREGPLTLTSFLSLHEGCTEGLLIEAISNKTKDRRIYFPIEADSSKSKVPALHIQRAWS
jgi:hypothetical protein